VTDIKELAARMQQTLDHAQATGPNPTSQRALEYRLAEAINVLSSPPSPALSALDSPPDHGGGEGWQKEAAEFKEALNAAPDLDPYDGRRLLMLRGSKLLHALLTQESEDGR